MSTWGPISVIDMEVATHFEGTHALGDLWVAMVLPHTVSARVSRSEFGK